MIIPHDNTNSDNSGGIDLIVVGLGNPGPEYAGTRHNLGFRALDEFLKYLEIPERFVRYGKAKIQVIKLDSRNILLVKPSTYMNLSGTAVIPLLHKHGLSIFDVLVVHDEMDLPPGRLKMLVGGGASGHKGVLSIIGCCGERFTRLKIGIGSPSERRENIEPHLSDGAQYVLDKLTPEEETLFSNVMQQAVEGIRRWIVDGPEKTMTWFNMAGREKGESGHIDPAQGLSDEK